MPRAKKSEKKRLKIRQLRSLIGVKGPMKETVYGLGLRRIRHLVEVEDTPSIRGMIFKVKHLIEIVEGEK